MTPVLSRNVRALWGPLGRQVVADVLHTLPFSAADSSRAHLVLIQPQRRIAAWGGSRHAEPTPQAADIEISGVPDLRAASRAELLREHAELEPLVSALEPQDDFHAFPLTADGRTCALLLVAPPPSRKAAASLKPLLRLSARALALAHRSVEEQRELEGYRVLSHLLDSGAPRDRRSLAQALGRSMAAVTQARMVMILARADSTAPLVVIGSRGWPSRKASGLVAWPNEAPWSEATQGERPVEVDTSKMDSAWQAVLREPRVLLAPVYWKGFLRSLLIFPADPARAGGPHLMEPERLASVGAHAGLLWQNAELIQRLRRDEEVLQGLMQRAIQVQEEERRRIASDIHDGVTQRIISIWYRLLNLEKLMDRSLDEARAELAIIKQQLDATLQEARSAIYNLRPSTLDDLGLLPSLTSLVTEFRHETGVECQLEVRGEQRLPGYVEVGIYRIAQEALRNVKKHAQATSARMSLSLGDESIRLTVSDNGRGFQRKKRGGGGRLESFGLESMEERAQMLGAELFVRSNPGEGTTVRVAIPWRAQ